MLDLLAGFEFQSHCGAIKSEASDVRYAAAWARFNPTVVRLKGHEPPGTGIVANLFQSHCGAIKSLSQSPGGAFADTFQSHCGAIKSLHRRLLRGLAGSFQSHCGAIKSRHIRIPGRKTHVPVSIPLWCD